MGLFDEDIKPVGKWQGPLTSLSLRPPESNRAAQDATYGNGQSNQHVLTSNLFCSASFISDELFTKLQISNATHSKAKAALPQWFIYFSNIASLFWVLWLFVDVIMNTMHYKCNSKKRGKKWKIIISASFFCFSMNNKSRAVKRLLL